MGLRNPGASSSTLVEMLWFVKSGRNSNRGSRQAALVTGGGKMMGESGMGSHFLSWVLRLAKPSLDFFTFTIFNSKKVISLPFVTACFWIMKQVLWLGALFVISFFVSGMFPRGNADTVHSAKFHKLAVLPMNMKTKDVHFLTEILFIWLGATKPIESPLK